MRKKIKSHVVYIGLLLLLWEIAPALDNHGPEAAPTETTLKRVQNKGVLTICADPRNLPYSSSDPKAPGVDIEVAQLLAKGLGVTLKFHWLDTLRESLLADMLREHCDCVLGVPIEERAMEETIEIGKRVNYSTPYLGTGYVLVAREGQQPASVKKLEDIRTETLGAEAGSIAGDLLKQKGYNRRVYRSQIAVLNGLQKGDIAFGMLWANAGWLIENGPPNPRRGAQTTTPAYPDLKLVEAYLPGPGFRWDVAVAVRKGDEDLKHAIDAVIQEKIIGEPIEKICKKYKLPYYEPFSQTEE